jgi:serine/threonine-protein kinase RsbW
MKTAVGPPPHSSAVSAAPGTRRVLVLGNGRTELRRLAAWVAAVARENCLALETAFRVDICLAEAVANVIEHGFPDGGAHEIRVTVEPSGRGALLTVDDEGRAFDPLSTTPSVAETLDDVRIGGYGLRLIRHFAHSCRYDRQEGRNIFTMSVRAASL